MSVIIRLQNLPWSANALDIRQYFSGLSIPEGGVHIVGGERGDAFIAFSTDEDARQAFNRNNGKIKEVQITLMLSSRQEMQRVIEAARTQSYAAFMQPTPAVVPMPAAVPAIVPAAVPEIKKEVKDPKTEKRDNRKRSRSKSRERKDRSRDRDRKDKRHRDRSRSRSRDRKDRRRRERSRSRGRSRSRERDRRTREHRKRSEERTAGNVQRDAKKQMPEVWGNGQNQNKGVVGLIPPGAQAPGLLGSFPVSLEQAKRTLNNLTAGLQPNGFPGNNANNFNRNNRDSWPPALNQNQNNFHNNRPSDNFQSRPNMNQGNQDNFNRFQPRNNFQRHNGPRGTRVEDDFTNCCVALEPFYGGYGDVRRFFQGLFISNKGIKFINDNNGRRTGIVYIQFGNRKNKEDALNLNGDSLNGITVTVVHLEDAEFEEAVDRYMPEPGRTEENSGEFKNRSKNITKYFNSSPTDPEIKDFSCLIVEDLPTYCKEQDILHIFSQHPLVALILTTKPRGGHIAYVKFSSMDVAKKAYEERSHHVIGGKQVTVKPCKDEEFEEINKQHEVDITSPKLTDIGTDCLSMSKLPPKTTDKDIADFFSDIGVIPTKIHLMSNNIGFTGQAYCEFMSAEEASRAIKKDETMLGSLHISVQPIKREEMLNILGHSIPAPAGPPDSVQQPNPPLIKTPLQTLTSPLASPGNLNPLLNLPGSDKKTLNSNPANRPPFFNRNFENGPPRGPRFGRGQGLRPRFNAPPAEHFEEAAPGCTVYMKNVPYKAGTNEILDFFDGYNITNNVSRRYNPNNTPSDEAKVVFYDPDEAFRAVQELHLQKIWERQIYLRQE